MLTNAHGRATPYIAHRGVPADDCPNARITQAKENT